VKPYRLDADEPGEEQDKSLKTANCSKVLWANLPFDIPGTAQLNSKPSPAFASSAGSAGWHIRHRMSGQLLPAFQGHLLGSTAMYCTTS
jgi:hypothetical protein